MLVTCCVCYAAILQGVKYQNPVSVWNKSNKTSENKEAMLEKGRISYGLCGCSSNSSYPSSRLSAPLSLMTTVNYFVETSYSLNIVCTAVVACGAFWL